MKNGVGIRIRGIVYQQLIHSLDFKPNIIFYSFVQIRLLKSSGLGVTLSYLYLRMIVLSSFIQ